MAAEGAGEEQFALTSSRHFAEWLSAARGALALTTYQAGKLFLIGSKPDGRLSIFERTFARSMGISVSADGRSFALATQYQVHRFDNVLTSAEAADGWNRRRLRAAARRRASLKCAAKCRTRWFRLG